MTVGLLQFAESAQTLYPIQFNFVYNSNWSSAPVNLQNSITQAAANFSANLFAQFPCTLNVEIGWGTVGLGTQSVTSGTAATITQFPSSPSYSTFRPAIIANGLTTEFQNTISWAWPVTDFTSGGSIVVTKAQAKVLGLIPQDSTTDWATGYDNTISTWFVGGVQSPNGGYDGVGTSMHEWSEGMGRQWTGFASSAWYPLNRYRFSSAGNISTAAGYSNTYFSIDNGTTNLGTFNTSGSGDYFDWQSGTTASSVDCCNNFATSNVLEPFTSVDYSLMDMIGWTTA